MKKKFVTNLALVIFLNLLVKPFWIFGIDRSVQNIVGAGSYGLYFSLFNFSVLLNILLDMGLTNYNNRNIARNPEVLPEAFSGIVGLKLVLSVFYAIVCFGAGWLMGYQAEHFRLLWILVLNQFLASFILYLRSNISGLHYFSTDSLLSVLDRALVILICGFLIWSSATRSSFRVEWFIYSQTASYSITLFIAFIIVLRRAGKFHLKIDIGRFASMLRDSYPFALLILLMYLYLRMDSVLIERLLENGKIQVGIYAQSFRILDAAYMFGALFAGLLLPIFSRMIKQNERTEEMLGLSLTLIFLPSLYLSALGIFYPVQIMNLLYHEHTVESSRIFPLLMTAFLAISVTFIFGTFLTANRNLKELNLLAFSAVVLNLGLNLFLIPRIQSYGAAVSCLVTQLYVAFVQSGICLIKLKIRISVGLLLRIGACIPLILFSGYLISEKLNNWYLGISLLLVWTGIVALALKLVKVKEIMRLLPSEKESISSFPGS